MGKKKLCFLAQNRLPLRSQIVSVKERTGPNTQLYMLILIFGFHSNAFQKLSSTCLLKCLLIVTITIARIEPFHCYQMNIVLPSVKSTLKTLVDTRFKLGLSYIIKITNSLTKPLACLTQLVTIVT